MDEARKASIFAKKPRWWSGRAHALFTVVVFVILASLDNAAIGVLPPLAKVIARDLGVSEAAIGFVMAASILITAVTAVPWGYLGDRTGRKKLLLYGTGIWAAGTLLTGLSASYVQFLAFQAITAVGLGCILSVGFSVISDFVSPRRRGLAMSFWGLSQGIGLITGNILVVLVGSEDWSLPFFAISGAGLVFAFLYLFTFDPSRGRAEPELAKVFDSGGEYEHRIEMSDIPDLASRRTNIWLIVQGFTAQFAYGSLVWLPILMQAKVEAEGYTLETAVRVGTLFAVVFQTGGLFAIVSGQLGDIWARRDPRGRAYLSTIGIVGAIPLFLVLFFLPLSGLDIPEPAGTADVILAVFQSFFSNAWVVTAFVLALGALALTSADSPNWFALISDVNPPENRGTIFGIANLSNGVGRSAGNWLTGVAFTYFESSGRFSSPWNYAVGLALFQLFFIPTGFSYYKATKTIREDIADVKRILTERAQEADQGPPI